MYNEKKGEQERCLLQEISKYKAKIELLEKKDEELKEYT